MQTYVHTVVYVSAEETQEIGDTTRIAFNSMAFYKVRLRQKNYTLSTRTVTVQHRNILLTFRAELKRVVTGLQSRAFEWLDLKSGSLCLVRNECIRMLNGMKSGLK